MKLQHEPVFPTCPAKFLETAIKVMKISRIFHSISTMWKVQDFTVTHILREINFGESRRSKTAFWAILGALNFVDLVNLSLQKVKNA